MKTVVPVLLAGGSGTRLWPMSSREKPKQFHRIASQHTMLQQTVMRARGKVGDVEFTDPIIVSNAQFGDMIAEQMKEIGCDVEAVVLEPIGRNTAPAVAVAAQIVAKRYPESYLLFLPADHVITDVAEFRQTIDRGASVAAEGRLVTFGVVPRTPETGYGYILRGAKVGTGFAVDRFVEKPNLPTAESYLAHGGYYWNAGIFLFPLKLLQKELAMHSPALVEGVEKVVKRALRLKRVTTLKSTAAKNNHFALGEKAFSAIQSISIDYALMEKTSEAAVVPMDAGWSDIGSWSALSDLGLKGGDQSKLLLHNSEGAFALSSGPKIAVIGVPGVVVIATPDGILVVDRKLSQDVKIAYTHFEERQLAR